MKLRDFKKMVNALPESEDDLEVYRPLNEGIFLTPIDSLMKGYRDTDSFEVFPDDIDYPQDSPNVHPCIVVA